MRMSRYKANVILDAILAYKKREGEWPSQRALCVEADCSLGFANQMVALLAEKGFVRLSKTQNRIIDAWREIPAPQQENTQ